MAEDELPRRRGRGRPRAPEGREPFTTKLAPHIRRKLVELGDGNSALAITLLVELHEAIPVPLLRRLHELDRPGIKLLEQFLNGRRRAA